MSAKLIKSSGSFGLMTLISRILGFCRDMVAAYIFGASAGYDAFILDPPAFGRGGKDTWKIERDFPKLLELVDKLLSDKPLFVLLSCHAQNLTASDLGYMLEGLKAFKDKRAETFDLDIPCEVNEDLKAGACARIIS